MPDEFLIANGGTSIVSYTKQSTLDMLSKLAPTVSNGKQITIDPASREDRDKLRAEADFAEYLYGNRSVPDNYQSPWRRFSVLSPRALHKPLWMVLYPTTITTTATVSSGRARRRCHRPQMRIWQERSSRRTWRITSPAIRPPLALEALWHQETKGHFEQARLRCGTPFPEIVETIPSPS